MAAQHDPAEISSYTVIVEHLDPELEDWQALEYKCIAEECASSNPRWRFVLSGLPAPEDVAQRLSVSAENATQKSVESLYSGGGRDRVCLLDPKADQDLSPEDGEHFDVFLFGGILGDDPPRDRTGELRKLGYQGRRLGVEQMTTDTAARVTRLVVSGKKLDEISYVDRPDIEIPSNDSDAGKAHPSESVSMPFRYVQADDGKPIMPKGMLDLLACDADKGIMDLL